MTQISSVKPDENCSAGLRLGVVVRSRFTGGGRERVPTSTPGTGRWLALEILLFFAHNGTCFQPEVS
jgi:hypothetical protein